MIKESVRKGVMLCLVVMMVPGCISRNFTGVKGVRINEDEENPGWVPKRAYVRGLPTGNDSYSMGFRAGCQTIMGIVGAGTMRMLPEKIDPEKLSGDKMYLRGWHDGDTYCNDRLDWEGH